MKARGVVCPLSLLFGNKIHLLSPRNKTNKPAFEVCEWRGRRGYFRMSLNDVLFFLGPGLIPPWVHLQTVGTVLWHDGTMKLEEKMLSMYC